MTVKIQDGISVRRERDVDMKIAAVVVTFNRKEYLKKNLEALFGQKDAMPDIIVIDNASTDGTFEEIQSWIAQNKIIYKNTGKNLGGAGGFSVGVRYACELQYDYIWLMDDDTYPYPDALARLIEAHNRLKGHYGYLAGTVLWKDGSLCKMNEPKFKKNTAVHQVPYRQIVQSTFVSFFVPRKTVEKYGLPIKEFFIWGDDVEYSRRIALKEDSYLVDDSKVLHDTKNNVGSNIVYDDERLERYRYAYRNEMYIARHEKGRMRYQICKICYHIVKIIFLSSNKKEKIRLILEASREGKKFNPQIEFLQEHCNE